MIHHETMKHAYDRSTADLATIVQVLCMGGGGD